ncbi:hypothetical protein PCH70_41250 [Pseudomonas cichorii JBC1]|nr:hypothetical protein PCH70_41250 [Pseudomonas cichorii JBC1]
MDAGLSMMKVLSYSLLTKTSEESHKKNIIHEISRQPDNAYS